MALLLLLTIAFLLFCYYLFKQYTHFYGSTVPFKTPVPILGNLWRSVLGREHIMIDLQRLYHEVGDENCKVVGMFQFMRSSLILKDPEVIKHIAIKEFDHFSQRPFVVDDTVEPLFGKILFFLKGQKWRDMRAAIGPAFTSSRIREMCVFMSECGDQMADHLKSLCKENYLQNGESSIELETRDLNVRYITDVLANVVFGFKTNSFKNRENEFFNVIQNSTNFNIINIIKMMFSMVFPRLAKFLGWRFFSEYQDNFFRRLVLDSMKHRCENKIVRRDMINLLIQAKEGSLKYDTKSADQDAGFATVEESEIGRREIRHAWTDDDLVAQAVLFFVAGFDTAAVVLSFILHELAENPEVQKKLHDEIDASVQKNGQEVTYQIIQDMKYLDMVVSEGLRKWPPLGLLDRLCLQDTVIGPVRPGEGRSYTVKKGDMIWLPVYAYHHDPKYWPNPSKFEPERFSDENKSNIKPYTYLPFGVGPRNCIGSRFALMEAKIMLYRVLASFRVDLSKKTCIPVILEKGQFSLKSPKGMWLKFIEKEV